MNKRLQMLEQMTAAGQADEFAWYALALEYKKEARPADALATFGKLRESSPDYLPMYLMAGQLLLDQGSNAEAAEWLRAGVDLAKRVGDGKALSELETALGTC